MVLCNHKDFDDKKACFDAYNRWIAEFETALRTPEEGIADLREIKRLGLRRSERARRCAARR